MTLFIKRTLFILIVRKYLELSNAVENMCDTDIKVYFFDVMGCDLRFIEILAE